MTAIDNDTGRVVFRVTSYSGWHALLHLLPQRFQAQHVAKVAASAYRIIGQGVPPLILQLPGSAWYADEIDYDDSWGGRVRRLLRLPPAMAVRPGAPFQPVR